MRPTEQFSRRRFLAGSLAVGSLSLTPPLFASSSRPAVSKEKAVNSGRSAATPGRGLSMTTELPWMPSPRPDSSMWG